MVSEAGILSTEFDLLTFRREDGEIPNETIADAQLDFLTAAGEISAGEDGLIIGAGANILGGAIEGGTLNPESNIDARTRVGASYGVGAGIRLYWGDPDNDGTRDLGFGFDQGSVSVDVRDETFIDYLTLDFLSS